MMMTWQNDDEMIKWWWWNKMLMMMWWNDDMTKMMRWSKCPIAPLLQCCGWYSFYGQKSWTKLTDFQKVPKMGSLLQRLLSMTKMTKMMMRWQNDDEMTNLITKTLRWVKIGSLLQRLLSWVKMTNIDDEIAKWWWDDKMTEWQNAL